MHQRVSGGFQTNYSEALIDAVKDSLGLGMICYWQAQKELQTGELVLALPEFTPGREQIIIPDTLLTDYERNVYLKHNLVKVLLEDGDLTHHYWIVNGWGGIGSFKNTDRNNSLIKNLMSQLDKGRLRKSEMGVIASLSKIASFYDPTKYAIYDSRAVYSLNWLIFKYCDTKHLFPQPSGRGEAVRLDMETVYTLSGIDFTVEDSQTAYFKYCELMKYISGEVYGDTEKPYMAEMMLFQITGDYIRKDKGYRGS